MKFILNYFKTIIATIIILVLSFAKFPTIEKLPVVPNADKIVHLLMYLTLTIIALFENYKTQDKRNKQLQLIIVALVFPLFLAAITELIQSTPLVGRYGDVYDWLSNTIGILIGWGLFFMYKKIFIKT